MTETNEGPQGTATRFTEAHRAEALALIRAVTEADGVSPISESGRLALLHDGLDEPHFTRYEGGRLVGYLYLAPPDADQSRTAELCVAPDSRRRGIGRSLIEAALADTAGMLHVWAHGSLPGTEQFAARLGLTAVRELRLMELKLGGASAPDLTPPQPPEGVKVDTFRPGEDEDAWLALNARAFAHHPEQGSWTRNDLAEREAEPWFDPAGFFLARSAEGLIGFHWTKVHPAGAYGAGRVGEIYVLGVDPQSGRRGLGRLLALVGLQHLAQSGLENVILYVDGDNTLAVRLYLSLGFGNRAVDTMYERRGLAA
ncbi:MAG TPA: mycothiol synthase [Actinocrinis sp.]|uniref:mycothiol synthase n=1 Tax=Actinocrinis sp. TaxID=1920516 RepID=UPI002D2AAAA2|nr:mycothiol synthase [Actinocrinis sp.]HZU57873.1 mycothiol synthase [Actinocrinis sp.]